MKSLALSKACRRLLGVTLVSLAASCGPAAPPPAPPPAPPSPKPAETAAKPVPRRGPPLAERRPVAHEYFGTKVTDDYEWLEDPNSPETKAWVGAQNAWTRGFLDQLPDRAKIRARVSELMSQPAPDYLSVKHVGGSLFVLVEQPPKQQPLVVVRNANADASSEKVVVDPNAIDPSGKTAIDWFVPSPDGKLLAVSLSKGGTESGDVHLFEVATGKEKGETIARVNGGTAGGSLAWNQDGTGFWYTRYPRKGERPDVDLDFYQQVHFHKLGTTDDKDTYAIGKDFPRIAEVELRRSDDGRTILATVANGDGGEFEHHVLANGKWTRLTTFADEIVEANFGADGKIYGVSRKDAPKGKVVSWSAPWDKPPVVLVPEEGGVLEDVVATKDALYLLVVDGGPSALRRTALSPKPEPLAREPDKKDPKKKAPAKSGPVTLTIPVGGRGTPYAEVPILPVSSVSAIERVGDDLLFKNESFTEPPAWYRYVSKEHRVVKTSLAKPPPADMSDVEVERVACTSKDGTPVPMSVLTRKGARRDGTMPGLLTGYGGYGVVVRPRLRPWYRVWLDAGGVVGVANLRGGGELGEAWHKAGKLTKKQNVFDDFAACAKTLFDRGLTRPEHLAITGRSNGGLLMGAIITQHPELFRAAVSGVGIYDMLRTELSPNGAFNVTEYGTVKDEAQFRAMLAYSPLHNVKDGAAYPSVLLSTGANDPRVDPYHSRKFLARLQGATSTEHPILLRASSDVGHGMGSPLGAEIDETADEIAFLLHELGVQFSAR